MKKISLVIVLLGLMGMNGFAQDRAERREQVKAQKIAFITEKVQFSSAEAEKFWPVYNKMEDEADTIRKEQHRMRKDAKSRMEEMGDQEIYQHLEKEMDFNQRKLDLHKKYYSEFKKILPAKKLARYYKAEQDFKKELLKKMRQRPAGGGRQ